MIMNVSNKRELDNTASNHAADIDYKDFYGNLQKMYKKAVFFLHIWYYISDQLHYQLVIL